MRWFLILALCSCLRAQDFSTLQHELLGTGYAYADGPAWSSEGYLIFSDAPNNRLMKWTPGAPPAIFRENANGPMGNAFDAQHRLYTCESRARRITRTDARGRIEVIAERWQGKRLNGPDDLTIRKDGNIYFTDPAFGYQADARELDFYGIFRITPKGELEVVAKKATRPNGIALSANGRTLFVTDSDKRSVISFDLDRSGAASNEQVVVADTGAIPNGLRTDEKDNLYLAAGKIQVFAPGGKKTGEIDLTAEPSNCAFGGPDWQTFFISARKQVFRAHLDVKGSGF